LTEAECVELSDELELSNKRTRELQKSLEACSSNQSSLDYSDSDLDD